jgi:CIC family chloride channel protein
MVRRRFQVPILRFFRRLHLNEQHFLIGLAFVVGVGGGLGAVVFRRLLAVSERLFLTDLRDLLGLPVLLPLVPATGGLLAGILVYRFAREAKGHGVPEVMDAVITRRGVIRPRVVVVKAMASALTLGSGGSAGSEGPIIQIGSALGSTVGQWFRVSEAHLKALVACGAAAGISAIFNAPIAGVLFAVEIILGDLTIAAFTPVVISSVLAAVVAQGFAGDGPVFHAPDYHFAGAAELVWFGVLAGLAGVLGVAFIKVLYASEDFFDDRLLFAPAWLKPALGGALVGGVGLYGPQAMGVGYDTIESALRGELVLSALAVFLGLKLLTTPLTLGSGGSGGCSRRRSTSGRPSGAASALWCRRSCPASKANRERSRSSGWGRWCPRPRTLR